MSSTQERGEPEQAGVGTAIATRTGVLIDRVVLGSGRHRGVGELRRLRILTAATISITVVAAAALVIGLVTGDTVMAISSAIGLALSVLALVLVRFGVSAAVVSHALGGMLTSLILGGSLMTDGVIGPGAFSFVVVPVLMTLALGGRAGWAWCTVVVAADLVLYVGTDAASDRARMFALNAILDAVVLTACAHAFDILRRRALDEANRARIRAEEAVEAKSRFLANMSHEIRTPMNGVLGMLGLLLDSELGARQREHAKIAHSSGVTLLDLINDILDVSKIEAGQMTLEATPFDLRGLIEDVLDQAALDAQVKGVALACRYPLSVPITVVGDHGRIRQVVLNLVSNAVKFTERGHVLVSVEAKQEGGEHHRFRIAVEDTGIGIPLDRQRAVFEHFRQVDMSTTRVHGGTGLGLAIVRELATLMGGEVGLHSEPGEGSTFWVELPLSLGKSGPDPALATPLPPDLRVLVVDAHEINRHILVEQLQGLGLEAESCASGDDALVQLRGAAASEAGFSLVLLDQDMPGLGGLALSRRMQQESGLDAIVRVMLCPVSERAAIEELEGAGVAGYLVEPVHRADLAEVIAAVCGAADAGTGPMGVSRFRVTSRSTERSRSRVLVVEDNAINQKVARRVLEQLGCRVDVASDGESALRLVDTIPFDLVFMDVQMPIMDGLQATAEIRRREQAGAGRHLPVVAMTAHAMASDRERCLAAGMDDYVSKPVQREELVRVLRRLDG